MNNLVLKTVSKYELLQYGDKVIVCLSGGADSVALLNVLVSFKEKYDLTVYAAHLNHNLRGEESKRDEDFCKVLCKKYNVKLFLKSVDIKAKAEQQKISSELCGRNERYKFFEELSKQLGAKIATAHTASDNAETLIFNIARGASVSGVSAIPPKRENIIRPLIEVTRCIIEDYCKSECLEYITDSTNLTDDYTRNKIRHNIIPVLKKINPQFEVAAMHLSENAREVNEYINRQAKTALYDCKTSFGYDCKKLLQLDKAILKYALIMMLKNTGAQLPQQKHIELMTEIIKTGGAVNISNRVTAVAKQNIFRIVKDEEYLDFKPIKLKKNVNFEFNNKQYSAREININYINGIQDLISTELFLKNAEFRTRRPNDKFTYPKRKITKPLRKVMNEMKIPSEIRNQLIVLAVDSTVLWCENIGVSLQGKSDDNSESAIKIEINKKMAQKNE